jgi:8-oxo-dGTP diphosphatase
MPPDPTRPPGDRLHVVGAAILRDGRCLVAQRAADRSMPLLWEFPGGKVERGEAPREALARELEEELGVPSEIGDFLARGTSTHEGRRIVLDVFLARIPDGEVELREHASHGWFGPEELDALDWPEADLPILPELRRILREERS